MIRSKYINLLQTLAITYFGSFLEIYQSAMDLYGLIHARFVLSPWGLAMMKEKYMLGSFGYCPRVLCERQNVLPIGVSEELSTSRVKVYCPRC